MGVCFVFGGFFGFFVGCLVPAFCFLLVLCCLLLLCLDLLCLVWMGTYLGLFLFVIVFCFSGLFVWWFVISLGFVGLCVGVFLELCLCLLCFGFFFVSVFPLFLLFGREVLFCCLCFGMVFCCFGFCLLSIVHFFGVLFGLGWVFFCGWGFGVSGCVCVLAGGM